LDGKVAVGAESLASIHDAMERASKSSDQKSAAEEAQGWLEDFLTLRGGREESAKIKKAAYGAGHSEKALRSARRRLKIELSSTASRIKPGGHYPTHKSNAKDHSGDQSCPF
jgi:hypothetical protein